GPNTRWCSRVMGSRASPNQNPTATHRWSPESPPFRPGCQPPAPVAFSHSTNHRPAEHGDASEEYERAYDDPDEPAGVRERPRLRHPVPHRRTRDNGGRRGGAWRAPFWGHCAASHARRAPRVHLSSAHSAGSAPGRGTPGARGPIHQPTGSSFPQHTPDRGRQGRTPLMNAWIANGTASRRRNRNRVKGVSTMTTNRVRVLMTQ